MAIRTDFTAGEVLAAADLNDTFGSKLPYEYGDTEPTTSTDGFLWFDDNDTPPTPKFWDGSAFANLAPAGGLTLIDSETFSAVSAVNVNGCFSATYRNYRVLIVASSSEAGVVFNMRLRVSGSDTTTNYQGALIRFNVSTSSTSYDVAVTDRLKIGVVRSGNNTAQDLTILEPFLTVPTKMTGTHVDANQSGVTGGSQTGSTSFDGFSIYADSGTISGTLYVYGMKV
jgi:hypothetical protein